MSAKVIEDYLKTIYELQQKYEKVTTSALADALNVASASVTAMVKKFAEQNGSPTSPSKDSLGFKFKAKSTC